MSKSKPSPKLSPGDSLITEKMKPLRIRKWRGDATEGRWRDAEDGRALCPIQKCVACSSVNTRSFSHPGVIFMELQIDGKVEMRRIEKYNEGWPSLLGCAPVSEAEAIAELSGLFVSVPSKGTVS